MTGLKLRAMRPADFPAVAAIYAARTGEPPPESSEARIGALVRARQAGSVALVALGGKGEVAGYVLAEVRSWEFGSAPAGWIFGLGVRRELEGRGVAHALLGEAVARLGKCGVKTVRTMVSREDVDVLRFFRGERFVAGPYTQLELDLEEARP